MFQNCLSPRLNGPWWGLLVLLSICLVLNFGAFIFSLRILMRGGHGYTYLAGDRPRELPINVGTVQVRFHDDPIYYGMQGFNATAEWNAIRPPGKGFVFLGKEHYAFDVSMWHQMHCLNHIRTVLVYGDDGSDHTAHCFHYLRQSILCAADTTLEPGGRAMNLANGGAAAAGLESVHTCRDWRQVYDWLEREHEKWTPEMHERFHEISR